MKGVSFARAPAIARSIPGRTSGSTSSIGSMNDMVSVEPGASDATWPSVAAIAFMVRYMLTPVDATTAGRSESKPDAASRSHHEPPASKSTGTKPQERRDTEAELDEPFALPRLRAGLIDLEHYQT